MASSSHRREVVTGRTVFELQGRRANASVAILEAWRWRIERRRDHRLIKAGADRRVEHGLTSSMDAHLLAWPASLVPSVPPPDGCPRGVSASVRQG